MREVRLLIAESIREARVRAGLTQTALAKRMNAAQELVSRMESPADKNLPTLRTLLRLAEALNCSLKITLEDKPMPH